MKKLELFNWIKETELKLLTERYTECRENLLIFFMIAFVIYKNKKYLAWDRYNDIFKSFIVENDKFYFNNIDKYQLQAFETAYMILSWYPTHFLVDELHKIDIWKDLKEPYNNYRKKDMLKYFKNNKPFFVNF